MLVTVVKSRLGVVSLVPAGALAGHAAAYALAGSAHSHGSHGYLGVVLAVAVPVALAALVWHAWQGARSVSSPRLGMLFLAQPVVFLAQEGVEHVLAGHGLASVAHSPAVSVGLVAQLAVAALSVVLVRAARSTGQAIASAVRRRARRVPTAQAQPPPVDVPAAQPSRRGTPRSERGPPGLLAPA